MWITFKNRLFEGNEGKALYTKIPKAQPSENGIDGFCFYFFGIDVFTNSTSGNTTSASLLRSASRQ